MWNRADDLGWETLADWSGDILVAVLLAAEKPPFPHALIEHCVDSRMTRHRQRLPLRCAGVSGKAAMRWGNHASYRVRRYWMSAQRFAIVDKIRWEPHDVEN